MKLTPRQIEVLTEIFDGITPDYREMTSAQRTGRNKVIDGLTGWNIKISAIEGKTREITAYGLRALEPHYPDKAKIALAFETRTKLEAEREAEKAREAQEREDASKRRLIARNAKLVEAYRRILTDHHFDIAGKPDDLVLSVGNRMAEFEGTV